MRIASLLPSATEIACALGLQSQIVSVSHACDYPAFVTRLPVLTRSAVPIQGRTPAQIDDDISAHLRTGASTYAIDSALLRTLAPDLILAQALCEICAVSEGQVHRLVHEQELGSRVLTLTPRDLEGVFRSVEYVGDATGTGLQARQITAGLRDRLASLRAARPPVAARLRVLALEWTDPPFVGGHWVPEQIAAAGGIDVLGRAGHPSFRTTWEEIAAARPDIVLVLPCGYTLDEVVQQAQDLARHPAWRSLPAVRDGSVWAVEASAWFSRPGPRVLDGIEAIAPILRHPLRQSGERPQPAGTRHLGLGRRRLASSVSRAPG